MRLHTVRGPSDTRDAYLGARVNTVPSAGPLTVRLARVLFFVPEALYLRPKLSSVASPSISGPHHYFCENTRAPRHPNWPPTGRNGQRIRPLKTPLDSKIAIKSAAAAPRPKCLFLSRLCFRTPS